MRTRTAGLVAAKLCLLSALLFHPATSAFGQSSIVDALLKLRTLQNNVSVINGRLYGGLIDAQITHTISPEKVEGNDTLFLQVSDPTGRLAQVNCGSKAAPKLRSDFDQCVLGNVDALVRILFPTSLSYGLSGRDAAQNHSELFLLTTALGVAAPSRESKRRSDIGGLGEYEWFSGNQTSGHAYQGLYQLQSVPVSFHGRYARQEDAVGTRSISVAGDYHPSFNVNSMVEWRVGFDAHSGLLYSRSSPLNGSASEPLQLGSIDLGGGVWTSAHKDYSRMRVGGGSLFQVSKSHTPSFAGSEFEFVTAAMNKRPLAYDIAYGGLVGFLTSDRTSVNAKFLETRAVATEFEWRRPSVRLGIVGFSYLFGGITPIDFGYKISSGGGLTAHSVFVLGNFHW